MLSSGGVLIEGGLSRYAEYGIPPHPEWTIIAFGLILLGVETFLFRLKLLSSNTVQVAVSAR